MSIKLRKEEHVGISLNNDVAVGDSGFDEIRFSHYALPEMNLSDVNTETTFLGKRLKMPLMVTAITGGYSKAAGINKDLALACERQGIAFGLGSQRAMIEDSSLAKTFRVRDVAPNVFLAGNIGFTQLKSFSLKQIEDAVEAVEADALCVHLNALHALVQKDGESDFGGCLKAIERVCGKLSVPVIVKEVGSGINGVVAKELEKAGVAAIDVAGVGGTSWAAVELYRGGKFEGEFFRDWGLTTVESLRECSVSVKLPLIASGGVRSGLDCAKAIRLGASLAGAAMPFLKAQSKKEVEEEIVRWKNELRFAMLLTRCKTLSDLRKAVLLP